MQRVISMWVVLGLCVAGGGTSAYGQGAILKRIPVPVTEAQKAEGGKVLNKTGQGEEEPSGETVSQLILIGNNRVSINSGAYLLNPYKIIETNVVEKGDAEAAWYIEFAYHFVTAWDPGRRQSLIETLNPTHKRNVSVKPSKLFNPFTQLDLQARFSAFMHDNGEDKTASAIIGSGDFAGEITAGLPLYGAVFFHDKYDAKTNAYSQTESVHFLNLVGSYGAITDRGAFDIHHRIFTGLGYRSAFDAPFDTKNREVLMNIQVGAAWIENADFVSDNNRTIGLRHGDIPDYDLKLGFGLEAELYYPLGDTGFLQFGTRLYANRDPNPWSAYLGLSFSMEKLTGLFD